MDKKNKKIQDHSKEKLLIYRHYLKSYLAIFNSLIKKNTFDEIFVVEPFAGGGFDNFGSPGSAIITLEEVKKYSQSQKVKVRFNEVDKSRYDKLDCYIKKNNFCNFAKVHNKSADDFLYLFIRFSEIRSHSIHFFVFLDPFGYTQIPIETLKKLFSLSNVDILFFVPLFDIYRFLKMQGGPAMKYIEELGDSDTRIASVNNFKDLSELLTQQFSKISQKEYVYSHIIKSTTANNNHLSLYFLSKSILAAKKFLEAKDKIKSVKIEGFDLFENHKILESDFIKKLLQEKQYIKNKDLYITSVKAGYLSKHISTALRNLENDNLIDVIESKPNTRKKKGFYLKESPEVELIISKKNEQN